jgi:integrase
MVLTGCRRGELCGLRRDEAHLDRGVLTVSRTLLQVGGKLTDSKPKTKVGERLIFLDAEAAGLLREHARPSSPTGCGWARRGRTTTWSSAARTARRGTPTT